MSSKWRDAPAAAITADLYRLACARFATGVAIVTTHDANGRPHGMTVNSFASVSLEPPLVLVSIDQRNAILGHFLTSAFFGINVLAENQEELSRRFSSAAENRFEGLDWLAGKSGVPLLKGVLAHMECAVTEVHRAGDHSILIGEVRAAEYREGQPLVFFDSEYRRVE